MKACVNFNFQKALKIKGKGRKREKARQDKTKLALWIAGSHYQNSIPLCGLSSVADCDSDGDKPLPFLSASTLHFPSRLAQDPVGYSHS